MGQPVTRILASSIQSSCQHCSLSNLCLPIAVKEEDLGSLEAFVQQGKSYNRGETIFSQNNPARSCFAVRSGSVKTTLISTSGEEQVTGFFLPGEIIGLDSLSNDAYACTALALERTSVCEIPSGRLEEATRNIPGLQHHVFQLMSHEIQNGHQMSMLLSKHTAEERMASLLLSLSTRFQRRRLSPTRFTLPMARNDIANFLGLAVETVSRVLTRFQSQGLMEIKGRELELLDIDALKALITACPR